jgi:diacylglycerol kinase family enzyme
MMKKHLSSVPRAMVIHSPHAGRSASLSHALTALERAGVEMVEVLPIAVIADTPVLGQQWKASGIDLVVAAGGDGLVGSVAMHALDGQLPLGILPLGTANDLARSVGIPQDIPSAARVIASGTCRAIDLGLARPLVFSKPSASHTSPRPGQHKLFAHALTVGLSVQFAQIATNTAIRQRYGRLTYPFALWQAFKTYRPIDAEIHFQDVALRYTPSSSLPIVTRDHLILRSRIAQVTAVNAPIFWGAFEGSVPGVSFTDRTLDMVIFEEASRYQLAQRMLHFFTSRYQRSPGKHGWHAQYPDLLPGEFTDILGIHHVQARSVTIFTENEPQAVTLDGEIYTQTPVEARVADERLRLLVPEYACWSATRNKAEARWASRLRLSMLGI